jgi:hypothetical protein
MNAAAPRSILSENEPDIAVDAVYFVVRVLRNKLRGYTELSVSPEPTNRARYLAQQALLEIAIAEDSSILEMSNERAEAYIHELEKLAYQRVLGNQVSANDASGRALLEELRNSAAELAPVALDQSEVCAVVELDQSRIDETDETGVRLHES